MTLRIKRVYDAPDPGDGHRVLVDRLWPRGLKRDAAALDEWLKDIAPTAELRTWWSHDPERFEDFAQRYRDELDANPAVETLREALEQHETLTLLFAARDPEVNHAAVLASYLRDD